MDMSSSLIRTPARRRTSRPRTVAALLGVAALTLSACGGGSSSTGAEDASASRIQLMAPADPGGGWDGTARAMAASMEGAGLAKSTQVSNVPGAGGTIGLAQLANETSEDYLMVMGLVMVGAIETNESPATLDDVTPIARLTAEDEIIVVPDASPYVTIQDLADDLAANGRDVAIAGGSAGGADHIVAGLLTKAAGASPRTSTTSPTPAAARPSRHCSATRSRPASPVSASTPSRSRPASCARSRSPDPRRSTESTPPP